MEWNAQISVLRDKVRLQENGDMVAISVDHTCRPPGGLLLYVRRNPGDAAVHASTRTCPAAPQLPGPGHAKLLTVLSMLFRPSSLFPRPWSPVPLHPPDKILLILKVPCHLFCEVFSEIRAGAASWEPAVRTAC